MCEFHPVLRRLSDTPNTRGFGLECYAKAWGRGVACEAARPGRLEEERLLLFARPVVDDHGALDVAGAARRRVDALEVDPPVCKSQFKSSRHLGSGKRAARHVKTRASGSKTLGIIGRRLKLYANARLRSHIRARAFISTHLSTAIRRQRFAGELLISVQA